MGQLGPDQGEGTVRAPHDVGGLEAHGVPAEGTGPQVAFAVEGVVVIARPLRALSS
jgi:hypothetical protein